MQQLRYDSRSFSLLLCLAAILVVGVSFFSSAATVAAIRDSKGTDFWITFLPNLHNNPNQQEDSLYVFITAEQPASGSIVYYDRDNRRYERTFTISSGEFFIFSTVFTGFELEGITSPNGVNNDPQNETAAPQVFHITSSSEVTVYGLNQARTTSDAFIALPTDVLGTEYYAVSYPSDAVGGYAPSEFAVVATEDATDITIEPSVATSTGPASTQQIRLNKGQAYLVQTQMNATIDLTGSKISSTKPIAVFAGHQRARVSQSPQSQSRDHLVEQLPPIPTWGGSAFVTPYPLAFNAEPSNFDKYRVLAAFDNTNIYVDGVFFRTMAAGEYYDAVLSKAEWITATGPILVTQYKKTSQRIGGGGSDYTGDPFMIVNSPVEQYLKRYQCFSIMAWEDEPDIYGSEQYITIIAPTDSVGTVKLNGVPIAASRFRPLSITSYSYTESLKVQTGINIVEANVGVGVYVYGYGFANSYGYIGGMKYDSISTFDPPDIIPPILLGTPNCDSLVGGAFDTLAFDRGIRSVSASQQVNTTVMIDSIVSPAQRARFQAHLVDLYKDGSFVIATRDSAGSGRSAQFDIPGYTIRATAAAGITLPVTAANARIGATTCATITLTNDGKFPQTVSQTDFNSNGFTVVTGLPVVIPPGAVRTIEVCFSMSGAGVFTDTMIIGNSCVRRPVMAFNVKVEAPLQTATDFLCAEMRGVFYDTAAVKLSVEKIEVISDSAVNTSVQIAPFNPGADSMSFSALLVNPFEDGKGSVVARNANGIQGWVDFTIPGFTVHADPIAKKPVLISDETRAGKIYCIPVELSNYGKFNRTVSSMRMKNDSPEFTIQPPSVTIPPGGKATIQVCFHSEDPGEFADSLIIGNECVERAIAFVQVLARKDTVVPAISVVSDSCRTFARTVVADSLKFDWGIESYVITDEVNCITVVDISLLPGVLAVEIQPVDRMLDARYRLVVTDSAGNIRDTTMIIQGFTISFQSLLAGTYPFGAVGQARCDSIPVYNSSELPYVLETLDLEGNTRFSAPLSQFPIVIAPRDTGYVVVCFEPVDKNTAVDTIRIRGNCLEAKVGVSGNAGQFTFSTETGCGVEIKLSSQDKPSESFVVQNFPNPASEMTTFRFGISNDGPVRVVLYNALGNRATVLVDDEFKAGLYDATVELSSLESGLYFYEFVSPGYRTTRTMSIVK